MLVMQSFESGIWEHGAEYGTSGHVFVKVWNEVYNDCNINLWLIVLKKRPLYNLVGLKPSKYSIQKTPHAPHAPGTKIERR